MFTVVAKNLMLDGVVLDLASLHTAYSATGANEVSGGSPAYAKKAITMAAGASEERAASSQPVFDVPASTTVNYVGLYTNAGTVFRGMFALGGDEKNFQIDVAANTILNEGHGYADNDRIAFYGDTPPTGITEGDILYVISVTAEDPDHFQVSLTEGGAAITITGQHAAGCKMSKVIPEVFGSQGTLTIDTLVVGLTA